MPAAGPGGCFLVRPAALAQYPYPPPDDAYEAPAGALLLGEPAAVLEDDEPHAVTVAAVPSARPLASSHLLSTPRRCLASFSPIVLFISILLAILSAAFRQRISFVFL
jgi:hypothetical protein